MELKTPIRLYWDVSPLTKAPLDYLNVCRQIIATKFLSIDLTIAADDLQTVGWAMLEQFADSPLTISLTVPAAALPQFTRNNRLPANVKTVLIQVRSLAELMAIAPPVSLTEGGVRWGVSYQVSRESWEVLPEVVTWCVEHRSGQLVLPMQRLVYNEEPFHLSLKQRQTLGLGLAGRNNPAQLSVVIHDPFLWRLFFPETAFPEGSCQGANTLLYIANDGTIFPCPTCPYMLGNLQESTLQEIVSGEKKRMARQFICHVPTECLCCEEAAFCGGGCRGRGYAVTGSWDKLDPGCR